MFFIKRLNTVNPGDDQGCERVKNAAFELWLKTQVEMSADRGAVRGSRQMVGQAKQKARPEAGF
ncbi:MAG TPA: hypothetical protein DCQ57_09470 [Enterobacteriaceae bacterium]|nr:hypothetical protein [Enterobacteriaceae bacterium]